MSRDIDAFNISGAEYDRLMDEREILRQEAAMAWREVDFIAKERTEHLEWRTKLANDLDKCERHRDALAVALNKAEAELAEARKDAERIEWVMRKVSGAEWRRLGVNVVANCDRAAIDAALAKEPKA